MYIIYIYMYMLQTIVHQVMCFNLAIVWDLIYDCFCLWQQSSTGYTKMDGLFHGKSYKNG